MNKNSLTKLSLAKSKDKAKTLKLGRILSLVICLALVKITLLTGLLFFPNFSPSLEFETITKAILKPQAKVINEEDMLFTARLEAKALENPALKEVLDKKAEADAKALEAAKEAEKPVISFVSTAYAAENIPPSPNPEVAIPNPSPLIPKTPTMESPIAPERFLRPDSATPSNVPAPTVQNPYTPADSAQRKQEELNRKEQELLSLQQQMEARMSELQGLENNLQTLVNTAGETEDEQLKHLIDVYSNMKSKQAATVLASLDEKVAVKILSGMRGRQAGEILSYMVPERAVVLSELLAKVGTGN